MATCHIALGSNVGDRQVNLRAALERIERLPVTRLMRTSSFLETAAVGGPSGQQRFLNAAAELRTDLEAAALFEGLQAIERQLGRQQRERWGPRPIALDILLFGRA